MKPVNSFMLKSSASTELTAIQLQVIYFRTAEYLTIDPTGRVTLTKSIQASLNKSELTLDVTARDDDSCCPLETSTSLRSNTTRLTVLIIGVNTQPTFPHCHDYRASVRENADVDTPVLRVCSDNVLCDE